MPTKQPTTALAIPDVDGLDALSAAMAYAAAGLYVGPVKQGSKHPGSYLGNDWPTKTSRDVEVLAAWFAGADLGIFIHCGRSGITVLDVDDPSKVPAEIADVMADVAVPYQSTRKSVEGRGHYILATPPGSSFGNSLGDLDKGWGEIRGQNGVIIVAPTVHENAEGQYRWARTGHIPTMPASIADKLRTSRDARDAASDAQVQAFLAEHATTCVPEKRAKALLDVALARADDAVQRGSSRHEAACSGLTWAMDEAAAGLYSAAAAAHEFAALFDRWFTDSSGDSSKRSQPDRGEFAGILSWAVGQAMSKSPQELAAKRERLLGMSEADFWASRDYLEHIHQHAQATRVAPHALLAVVLARTSAEIYPSSVLPALVGGTQSLNLYVALVAISSGGKSSALRSSDALHDWTAKESHIGSGEGLLKQFATRKKDGGEWVTEQHTERVLALVDEVDTLTALGSGRNGSTLLPTVRTMWDGAGVGFGYSDDTKAVALRRHHYRLGLVVGVQPERAADLISQSDAGTPQRFVWASTIDPDAPKDKPPLPGEFHWRVRTSDKFKGGQIPRTVSDAIASEIDSAHFDRLTGRPDAANGHFLLSQLKVAALLGALDGRNDVNDDDWALAKVVMARSNETRATVEASLVAVRARESDQRAESAAKVAVVSEGRKRDALTWRVARSVAKHVRGHQADASAGCTQACIWKAIASRDRKSVSFDEVVGLAAEAGWIRRETRAHAQRDATTVTAYYPGKEQP